MAGHGDGAEVPDRGIVIGKGVAAEGCQQGSGERGGTERHVEFLKTSQAGGHHPRSETEPVTALMHEDQAGQVRTAVE
ncbi:hypothetical protein GCM10027296_20350 [Chitinimonas naiadis]